MITRFLWQGMGPSLRIGVLFVLAIGIILPLLEPAHAGQQRVLRAGLGAAAHRQVSLLRLAGARRRSRLGLLRHPHARPCRLLRAGRLLHGHVPDAPDRQPRPVRQSAAARLHGVPELQGAALVLARLRPVLVRRHHDRPGAERARPGAGLVRLQEPRHRRLPLDHHPGHDLRPHARVLPERHGAGRQQRHDRLQGHPGLLGAVRRHARHAVLRLGPGAGDLPGDRGRRRRLALRQGADGGARRRKPHALPGLPRRGLQALRLRAVGGDGGRRGRALRAAGRHHQSQRVLARQLDRGGAVGRRRRPRHPDRPDHRRLRRQLRQDLPDGRAARGLAVCAGRPVHRRHAVPAQGHRRPVVRRSARAAPRARRGLPA